jgi:hypothetical protein
MEEIKKLVSALSKLDRDMFWSEEAEALIASYSREARISEVKKACENWEKNPTLPATYLIDRTKTIKEAKQNLSEVEK